LHARRNEVLEAGKTKTNIVPPEIEITPINKLIDEHDELIPIENQVSFKTYMDLLFSYSCHAIMRLSYLAYLIF